MSEWGYGSPTNSVGTATAASGTIVAANASRKYLRVANTGGTALYLALGGAAVVNAGIRLNGAGSVSDYYEMTRGQGNVYTGRVEAILTVAGTAQLSIVEGT